MLSSFLITFREGFEAFLVIGIIVTYLFKIGQKKYIRHVFFGLIAAIVLSIGLAYLVSLFLGKFEGKTEQIFEGSVMLVAAAVLTYMVFWMNKQAKSIRNEIESTIQNAITGGRIFGLFFIGFIAVFREGAETVLFFRAISFQASSRALITGGAIGLGAAVILSLIFFVSTVKINLSLFFKVTGILIMLIAAGLLSTSIHEFQEASVLPVVLDKVYDISHILSSDSIAGGILASLFGYNPAPSILEVIAYASYVVLIIILLRRLLGSSKGKVNEQLKTN